MRHEETYEQMREDLDRLRSGYIETTLAILRERDRCAKIVQDAISHGDMDGIIQRIKGGEPTDTK